jgi:hypothetical protein
MNTMLKQLPVIYNLTLHKNMRHGYKAPEIILLQIFLFNYSLLRPVIKADSSNSYTLRPAMLSLLKTFMELLFHDNLQHCHGFPLMSAVSQNHHCFQMGCHSGRSQSHREPHRVKKDGIPVQ